jgi:solute carrier family 25 protein 38
MCISSACSFLLKDSIERFKIELNSTVGIYICVYIKYTPKKELCKTFSILICHSSLQQRITLLAPSTSVAGVGTQQQSSMSSVIRRIWTDDGFLSFWRGTGPSLMRLVPGAGLYFWILELQLNAFPSSFIHSPMGNFYAGASSRLLAATLLTPMTVVKTRFEAAATGERSGGIWRTLRSIASLEGVRGLWSGYMATMLRDVPFSGLYFLFYSELKLQLPRATAALGFSTDSDDIVSNGSTKGGRRRTLGDGSSLLLNASSGALAGLLATVLTHPQDVIKTHLQLLVVPREQQRSGWNRFRAVLTQLRNAPEGIVRSSFRGLLPRLLRRPLQSVITWTLFERLLTDGSVVGRR